MDGNLVPWQITTNVYSPSLKLAAKALENSNGWKTMNFPFGVILAYFLGAKKLLVSGKHPGFTMYTLSSLNFPRTAEKPPSFFATRHV